MATLPTSERFFAPEITKVHFVPTIAAATLVYTRIELTAGTDLSAEIADLSGWMIQSNDIATPDLGTRFTTSIPGRKTVDQSAITFYADKAGADVRAVLTEGLNGYIVFMDGGDVPTKPSDVFPVRVKSVGKVRSTGDTAHQITVGFTITRAPKVEVAIPA